MFSWHGIFGKVINELLHDLFAILYESLCIYIVGQCIMNMLCINIELLSSNMYGQCMFMHISIMIVFNTESGSA